MMSRLWSRLLIVASIVTLAGVTFYFLNVYRSLRQREQTLRTVTEISDSEGVCAGLTALANIRSRDADLQSSLLGMRARLAIAAVGQEDLRGRKVLIAAMHEGLVDRSLCEQIRLAHEAGTMHPVLAFLRYTREGGRPCEEEPRLADVLDGLGSHRAIMLHALMQHVGDLGCLSALLAEKVALMVARAAAESPSFSAGLDVERVAAFLVTYAPLAAAQLGCSAAGAPEPSPLQKTLGCSDDARQRVLVHYRTMQALPATDAAPAFEKDSDVVLLNESGPFCTVMPATGGAPRTLACRGLKLASDIVLAARIETLRFGRVEADLIAGVAAYNGDAGSLSTPSKGPELTSWYAYSAEGEQLGTVRRIDLSALGRKLGEEVPDEPLRAFCRRAGAKYCYDVDWAHVVSRSRHSPALFLSRPAAVFLNSAMMSADEGQSRFRQAFARDPEEGALWRAYRVADGAELVVMTTANKVSLRFRSSATQPWIAADYGSSKASATSEPTAHLLAVLDLQQDGTPELLLQHRATSPRSTTSADELLLVRVRPGGKAFEVVNRLTVREY